MMTDASRGGLRILRPASSLVSFWAATAVVAFLFGDAALRGAWGLVARWLPLALLALWALWLVLGRSSVRYDRAELVVVNGLRVHTVPWARVVDVRRGMQLKVDLDDGRTITCFGGPFPGRAGRTAQPMDDGVVDLLAMQESARSSDAPVTVAWDLPNLAVGIILLVATGLALTLVRG